MVVFRAPPYQMCRICTTTRRNLFSAIEHLPPLQTIVFEARQFHLHSADVPDPNPQMDAVRRCVRENLSNPCQVPNILCTCYLSTDTSAMYYSWLSLSEGQVSVAAWDKRFWRSSTSCALRWDSWSKSLGGQAWFYLASISHIASYSVIIHPSSV